jgi:hypothetical protein
MLGLDCFALTDTRCPIFLQSSDVQTAMVNKKRKRQDPIYTPLDHLDHLAKNNCNKPV